MHLIDAIFEHDVGRFCIVTAQIVSSLEDVRAIAGGARYPFPFGAVSRRVGKLLSLSAVDLFPVGCMVKATWTIRLMGTTMLPIAMVLVTIILNVACATGSWIKKRWTQGTFMYLFYFLPGISITICSSFACNTFDKGTPFEVSYLAADMSINCNSAEYHFIKVYAGVMVAIFPVIVPFSMHYLLRSRRDSIEKRQSQSGMEEADADLDLEQLSVWFEPYKPDKWWCVF